jgi:hypothetical protein
MIQYLLLAIVFAAVAGYWKGCTDEKERFDDYRAAVEAVGKAQDERTKARIDSSRVAKREADLAHEKLIGDLLSTHTAELDGMRKRVSAGSRIVPTVPGAAKGRGGEIGCYKADVLDERVRAALDKFITGAATVLRRGEGDGAGFDTCTEWAIKEWKRAPN